ncbi:MAG: relaxase domain-containing protein [Aphanocapsa sp. GSE-SYN-MK-11-07L]|jgi:conjugative relaxase-like TrwC/TraI family protein|nr:relaxase domain-containing protein [Aphanocapsa sp. GSE-SYN-MK-11-07L]
MRSIHTIKSGDQAKKDYYTKDESLKQDEDQKSYYSEAETQSESEEMTQAVWFGKAAARLHLKGHALVSDFEQIYDGTIPGTQERIRGDKPREDHQENCLYDVVLTCPKSVSMQIHLGKDERVYQEYQAAVNEIAELIEKDYAWARIQVQGQRRIVQTEGILALKIPHHTTREQDMGVHTHLLIANGTYCADGKWRSLLDRGFGHAYYMGDYFEARLAVRLQAIGYDLRETVSESGHPAWELAGYSDEQIKVFSKRSENAKFKELVAQGYSRDNAMMVTRKAKDIDETLEEMQARWANEAHSHGIEAMIPKNYPISPKPGLALSAEKVLESAIRHYSHCSVHFTRDQIREYAFKLNRTFTIADLDHAITRHPTLVDYGRITDNEMLHGHFTTVAAVEREIRTLKAWMQGQNQATPILDREHSSQALEGIELKSGQRAAIIGVLASRHQHQIIHGLAGVGKTTALRHLKGLCDHQGVDILGFAPSIDAAQKLSGELGIETYTVQKLVKSNRFELKPGQLLILDEAGMVSAKMLDVVLQKANAAGARVLLVGDAGQNQAIEAGSPLRSLMNYGAETHHLCEILRQQNMIQKQAVELIERGHGLDALTLLNEHGYINPIADPQQRVEAIATEFLSLSPQEQANTLVVAGTHAEKDAIVAQIRAGLKERGGLGASRSIVQLRDRGLTPEEAKEVLYYRVGDYVTLSRDFKSTPLRKHTPYQVVGRSEAELVVASPGGRLYRFNPQHYQDKQVFSSQEMDVAVGDSLRWTSSNPKQGYINGRTIKIMAIEGQMATALSEKGLIQINLDHALAIDYTLTTTSRRTQGSDRPRVFVSATNDPTSNQEPFCVSISRQIKELKVWTEDYEGLSRRVAESSVQRNPLELLLGEQDGKHRNFSPSRSDRRPDSERAGNQSPEPADPELGDGATAGEQNASELYAGEGEYDPARSPDGIERLHPPVQGGDGIEQIREDGGIDRPVGEIDGQSLSADQRLWVDSSRGDGSSIGSSRGDQGLQAGISPEWENALSEALQEWSSRPELISAIAELARVVQSNQAEKVLVESGLAQKLVALTQQIDELTAERQPYPFAGMDELAQTLTQRQTEEKLGESLEQLQHLLDHVEPSVNVQAEMAQLAQVLQSVNDEQRFVESGLDVQISSLGEKLQAFDAKLQPHYQFTGMAELASTLSSHQSQVDLASNLQQISQSLSQLDQVLDQTIQRQRVDAIASGIEQWRSEQAIAQTILNHQYEGMAELAEVGQSLINHQAFVASGLDVQMSELAEKLQAFADQPTQYHFNDVVELAEVIHQRRAEEVITSYLEDFTQATERLSFAIENHPTLQHVAEVVRSLRNEPMPETSHEHLGQLAEQLRAMNLNPTPKPKPVVPFWTPEYLAEPPDNIELQHWEEFKRSAIHPDLIALNAESVSGQAVYDRLLSEKLATLGSGQYVTVPMARLMAQYEQVAEGGWWGKAGVDARSLIGLQPGEQPTLSTWGCFKPDQPRIDHDKSDRKGEVEYKKYENPLGIPRSLYLAIMPDSLAERIYEKHGIKPNETEKQSGFWFIVKRYNLPITVTEGVKKTWASLSQGEITVGVSGVNGVYRAKDNEGYPLSRRQINPELEVFATPGREFRFAYDQDSKGSTIRNVRRDLVRGVELLEARSCVCKVTQWQPQQGKGLDDLIANHGPRAYTAEIARAQPADREKRLHYRTEYNAIARQVKAELPGLSAQSLEGEIYMRALSKGDAKDGDRVLSQSDQARSLKDPAEVRAYINQIQAIALKQQWDIAEVEQTTPSANEPITNDEVAAQSSASSPIQNDLAPSLQAEQAELNRRVLKASQDLLIRFRHQSIQPSGNTVWQAGTYTVDLDKERFQVRCSERGVILEMRDEQLTGCVDAKDVKRFEAVLAKFTPQPKPVLIHNVMERQTINRLCMAQSPDRAQQAMNLKGLWAAEYILSRVGNQTSEGKRVFAASNGWELKQKGEDLAITETGGRGNILEFKDRRLQGSLIDSDVSKLEACAKVLKQSQLENERGSRRKESELEL